MDRKFADREYSRLLTRLEAARSIGNRRTTRQAARNFIRSPVARQAMCWRLLGNEAHEEQVASLMEQVEPFHRYHRSIRFWREPKRSSGHRIVCALPLALKVTHRIIRDALGILIQPNEHIFDIKGRGRDRLTQAVAAAMEGPFTHAFVADIRNCFPSVNPEALNELPLPREVIRYALDYRNLRFRHDPSREGQIVSSPYMDQGNPSPRRDGPSGVLQGSPASNLILAWLLNDMIEHIPEGCRAFLISDDLIVLAPSSGEGDRVGEALVRYCGAHQAGPFVLEGAVVSVSQGYEKLGYQFGKSDLTGDVTVDLSDFNSRRLQARLMEAVRKDASKGLQRPISAYQALYQSMTGFASVTDRENLLDVHLDEIDYQFMMQTVRSWRSNG